MIFIKHNNICLFFNVSYVVIGAFPKSIKCKIYAYFLLNLAILDIYKCKLNTYKCKLDTFKCRLVDPLEGSTKTHL